jgi:hypothetical protein
VSAYIHPSTIIKLIQKLEEILIRDQLLVIYTEAKLLIRDEKIEGKKSILFSRKTKLSFEYFRIKSSLSNS